MRSARRAALPAAARAGLASVLAHTSATDPERASGRVLALQAIVQDFLTPTNRYLEDNKPWSVVKTDKQAAKRVLFNAVQSLRVASILLKPFIPKSAEAIYTSFNFPKPWAEVSYADAAELKAQPDDLRVTAELFDGKPKPLFPRIG